MFVFNAGLLIRRLLCASLQCLEPLLDIRRSRPDISGEQARQAGVEALPSIKVAAPVACRVMKSYLPAVLPIGATCLLFPYHEKEASKALEAPEIGFRGEEVRLRWLRRLLRVGPGAAIRGRSVRREAFFHHAAFSSGNKELVCDIQVHALHSSACA